MEPKIAYYSGRPEERKWHTDARLYTLDPPLLGTVDGTGYLVEIRQIVVSGIKELTPMQADGKPVYRLSTVACTVDESAALFEAWLRGQIDHGAALQQIGYQAIGEPHE